jgi:hypothetical protein
MIVRQSVHPAAAEALRKFAAMVIYGPCLTKEQALKVEQAQRTRRRAHITRMGLADCDMKAKKAKQEGRK